MRLLAALLCALVLALPATASAAPTATTGDPKSVTPSGATLTATVDPGGAPTSVHFEYGTSASYGKNSDSRTVTTPGTVEIPVRSLSGSTTYHYRVVAGSGADRATGGDRTFTTAAAAPGATTGGVRSVTAAGATLTGRVDANGAATTYHFEYGTTPSLGSRTPDRSAGASQNPVSVSSPISGLAASTRVYYRLVAVSAGGTRNAGTRSFVTARGLRSLSIALSGARIGYGDGVTITGKLAGAAPGGVPVVLQYQPVPFAAPVKQLGLPVRTGRDGSYRFTLDPLLITARLRVATQGAGVRALFSPIAVVRSVAKVGLTAQRRKGRRVRFHGSVRPLAPNGTASLQRLANGRWVTIRRVHLRRDGIRSRYSITTRARSTPSTYRVMVTPRDRGAHARGYSRERTVR